MVGPVSGTGAALGLLNARGAVGYRGATVTERFRLSSVTAPGFLFSDLVVLFVQCRMKNLFETGVVRLEALA